MNTSIPIVIYWKTTNEATLAINRERELNICITHMDNANFATIGSSSLAINQFGQIYEIYDSQTINKGLDRIDLRRNVWETRKENKRSEDSIRMWIFKIMKWTKEGKEMKNKRSEETKRIQKLKREDSDKNEVAK